MRQAGIVLVLEYLTEGDLEGLYETLSEEDRGLVGGEEVLHPTKMDWEVIYDLSDYHEDDYDMILEDSAWLWDATLDLPRAGVSVCLIAGDCGLCDETHVWLAAPQVQVEELLRRVRDGDITTEDIPALRFIPGVMVETGDEKEVGRVENSAGGWYTSYERVITITVSGRSDHNGVYRFLDSVFDAPWQVGGNSGEVRGLIPQWR
jgi:hypothetical protein